VNKEGEGREATYTSTDGRIEISFGCAGNHQGFFWDRSLHPHQQTKSLAWLTVVKDEDGRVLRSLSPRRTASEAVRHAEGWAANEEE